MNQFHFNKTSFQIGEEFESFVEDKMFDKTNYTLLSKTHNYQQNSKRYVENSKEPDFKFEHTSSKQKFQVEAKYRSHFDLKGTIVILTIDKLLLYKKNSTKECPIFIILGISGIPTKPKDIYLIPINNIESPELHLSNLYKFKINQY